MARKQKRQLKALNKDLAAKRNKILKLHFLYSLYAILTYSDYRVDLNISRTDI